MKNKLTIEFEYDDTLSASKCIISLNGQKIGYIQNISINVGVNKKPEINITFPDLVNQDILDTIDKLVKSTEDIFIQLDPTC